MIRQLIVIGLVKALRAEAAGKPSLNRAQLSFGKQLSLDNGSMEVDAKPGDLPMGRLKRG